MQCNQKTKQNKTNFPVPALDRRTLPPRPPGALLYQYSPPQRANTPITRECIMPEPPPRAGRGGPGGSTLHPARSPPPLTHVSSFYIKRKKKKKKTTKRKKNPPSLQSASFLSAVAQLVRERSRGRGRGRGWGTSSLRVQGMSPSSLPLAPAWAQEGEVPAGEKPLEGDPWARLSGHGTPVGRAVGKGKRPPAPSCFLRAGAPGPVVFAGCRDSLPRRGLAQPRASASFSFALGPLPPHPQPRGAPTLPQAARTPLPWGPGGIVPSPVLPLGAGSWGWGAEQGGDTRW